MERYSNSIREVGQSGRRGALMITLDVHHPEIMEFVTVKNDETKVTGANISVKLTKEFLNAVKQDKDYELRWGKDSINKPKISKMISAKKVWSAIINSAWNRAEPGLLMWDNVTENTPADCYERFASKGTNPCSELNLSPLDSCRLLLQNLLSYVIDPFTKNAKFDFDKFMKHAEIAQRLMDDMVDLESEKIQKIINKIKKDPEKEETKLAEMNMWLKIKANNDEGRRTGTGITALGDTLAALGITYGSKKSIKTVEDIYRSLKLACYRSSVDMSKEFGPFKGYDANKEKNCPFIQRIKEEDPVLYKDMTKHGRRNVSLLTTAPAGSVSILAATCFAIYFGTTSGIEPAFMLSYKRRKKVNPSDEGVRVDFTDNSGDNWQEFTVYHPCIKNWMEITGETDVKKSPWYKACAADIDWVNRVKIQAAAQKHVCHSISSTINLPNNVSKTKVAEIYETAFKSGCKGITVYRDGCRTGVMVANTEEEIPSTRPKELDCDVHHIKVRSKIKEEWVAEEYFVLVGILENGRPYEVFAGKNGHIGMDVNKGSIKKVRNHYRADFDDGESFADINHFVTDDQESFTRLISMLLRNDVSIHDVVKQIEKTTGDLTNFSKSISRALKKYIPDGTSEGTNCPSCGSKNYVRQSGCATCVDCGHSKCM